MKTVFLCLSLSMLVACVSKKSVTEPYRPLYHFTPPTGWMNDPNGMVYYAGEYHLFYQHYPDSTVWGPMHWGHAVSKDLVHWQHLPIALYPDSLGYIFSGSVVVDWNNSSGFGTTESPPLVAVFTYHNMVGEKAGRIDFQTQGIAYSLDKGRTWVKYQNNPVLANPGIKDFRDPKVAWHEEGKRWVMTLAVKDHIEFYASTDLKQWNKLSEFGQTLGAHGGVWECPDLFPLQDPEGKTHWVLLVSINPGGPQGGSATQYFVGDFKEGYFSPHDSITRWIDHGADNYAGVTFSDVPSSDGRRLFMGWMSNWQYAQVVPTQTWRSAMTLPREIELQKNDDAYVLLTKPAREAQNLFAESAGCFKSQATWTGTGHITVHVPADQSFTIALANAKDEKVILILDRGLFSVDRTQSGNTSFHGAFPAVHQIEVGNRPVQSIDIYVDAASLEIFINPGEKVLTELVFPAQPYSSVTCDKAEVEFCVRAIVL